MSLNSESSNFRDRHINEASHVLEAIQKRYPQWSIDGLSAWAESWDESSTLDLVPSGKVKYYVGWWLQNGEGAVVTTPEEIDVVPTAAFPSLLWYGIGRPTSFDGAAQINFYGFMVDGYTSQAGALFALAFSAYDAATNTALSFDAGNALAVISGGAVTAVDAVSIQGTAARVSFQLDGFNPAIPFNESYFFQSLAGNVSLSVYSANLVAGIWYVILDVTILNLSAGSEAVTADVVGRLLNLRYDAVEAAVCAIGIPPELYRLPSIDDIQVGDVIFTDSTCYIYAADGFIVSAAGDILAITGGSGEITSDTGNNCP